MPIRNKWWPFTDTGVLKAPEEAGAYELGDVNGVVVYIGKSDNSIRSRLLNHRKRKHFMKVKHFRYKRVEYAQDAVELEAQLFSAFKKAHNGRQPRLQERGPTKGRGWWGLI